MIKYIVKRDGRKEEYNSGKIKDAMVKAFMEVDGNIDSVALEIINTIVSDITNNEIHETISVEEIQDIVENELMQSQRKNVAKAYITYRYKRQLVRESNTTDKDIKELIDGESAYWNDENSNKNPTRATVQRDYIAGISSTDITNRFLLPPDIVKADKNGIIHFHDKDYFVQHIHNCFHGETSFITSDGVRKFKDCIDGEQVKVVDKNGNWQKATVKKYGKQKMQIVKLQSGRTIKYVKCTYNHRWILKNGNVTTNLKVGDRLYCTPEQQNDFKINAKYFCMGFILGDGTDYNNSGEGVRVRLCGNKKRFAKYFIEAGYYLGTPYSNGDLNFCKKGFAFKSNFINNKIWKYLPHEYLYSLFEGYYAADGNINDERISTSNNNLAEMIRNISCLTGRYIYSDKINNKGTNYSAQRTLYEFRFCKKQCTNKNWIVKAIIRDDRHEYDAWCVEEPKTHSFTLDSGIVTGNCDLINLEDMLQNGTVINDKMIERPHKFLTAMTIATQIITAVTSSQYGGASITLTHLAPFVRDSFEKYKAKYISWGFDEFESEEYARIDLRKEIEDGVQTFNYQINSMSTTNGQAPFLSVFMYLGETQEYKQELAMIIEEFLNQRILGIKNEVGVYVTPAFPKLLYVLEEDNIHDNSPYFYLTELAAKCTAKRLVPDYISEKKMLELKKDKNGNGHCYPCMGCRSFLTPYIDENGKPKYYGRFNQGVVTINLVDIALSSHKDVNEFWRLFEERTELCHRALRIRHERLKGTLSDVAPILWQHGALARLKKGETIDKLLYGGYSTISLGYAGLYECVKYMTGESHSNGKGKEFGLQVMQKLNDKCTQWKMAERIDYSLYGTPIESGTYKFAKKLQERFGIIEGITDRDYITNSYHVPVFEEIDPFTKLSLESEFQVLSPGGAISYIECADMQKNIPAVIRVIKFIYDNIMYAELNTKSDYCQVCGYDGEIKIIDENNTLLWECPNCGNRDKNKLNVARRTCGYIGTNFWNQGRTQEIKERVVHLDNHELRGD